jgi:hypothetical protein
MFAPQPIVIRYGPDGALLGQAAATIGLAIASESRRRHSRTQ